MAETGCTLVSHLFEGAWCRSTTEELCKGEHDALLVLTLFNDAHHVTKSGDVSCEEVLLSLGNFTNEAMRLPRTKAWVAYVPQVLHRETEGGASKEETAVARKYILHECFKLMFQDLKVSTLNPLKSV
jgi:hypothetical protein